MSDQPPVYQKRRWIGAGRPDCVAENGMVASKHPLISEAGVKIMRRGGTAVDAAIAAAFMNCVVESSMNGIGGEGVMAIHLESGENVIVDYVGRPAKTCTPDMYELTEDTEPGWMSWRKVKGNANVYGYKASTTPGTVAGLTEALKRYGTMSLKEVMEPAITVAREGFVPGRGITTSIANRIRLFSVFQEWRRIYLIDGQYPYRPSSVIAKNPSKLIQSDLAKSMASIAEEGPDVFYRGWIAEAIAEEMERGGGLVTLEDLDIYEPIIHEPEPGSYRGYDVVYDPSHSGITMMQILKILEGYDLAGLGFGTPETVHLMAEAVGLAFADRFKYLGDPGYIRVPQKALASDGYAEELRKRISMDEACAVEPGDPWPPEPECTTALAVGDKAGNLVCVNQTLVDGFGCGIVVPGTGITMNNGMYGLNPEPGHANSIDGRKRRIQNVCPTILLRDGGPFMSVGAPGGRKIQVSVAHVVVNVVDHGMGIQDAIEAPKLFRETSTIYVDNRYPSEVRDGLLERGHDLVWVDRERYSWGRPVGVVVDPESGLLHGGVQCHQYMHESIAIGH